MSWDKAVEDRIVVWIVSRVKEKPGLSTNWLFENRPMLGSEKHLEHEAAKSFDPCLERARQEFGLRTTNKVWWPKGYIGAPRPKRPKKPPHPRQLNLVGVGEKK
jgi:hypothetical protein